MRCEYRNVERLACEATERGLAKLGIQASRQRIMEYCENRLANSRRVFLTTDSEPAVGAVDVHVLEFDSGLYGRTVGSLGLFAIDGSLSAGGRLSVARELAQQALIHAAATRIEMLSCRIPASEMFWVHALEEVGFRVMDVQCPLVRRSGSGMIAASATPPADFRFRNAVLADVPEIITIGRTAFKRSHLYADARLSVERTNALYEQWMRNDCTGRAMFVVVAEMNERVGGFLAGVWDFTQDSMLAVRRGHIDLIAVHDCYRGRGVGGALVTEGLRRFTDRGAEIVTVSTQATNLNAIHLYQRCGFLPAECEITMHGWSDCCRFPASGH